MIFVGIDWAESHHDVCVLDEDGSVLAKGRVPEGIEGVARLHEMVGSHADELSDVVVGIELDRGLLVGALVAAGYSVHAINPLSMNRYRDRHRVSGAKSDPGDARVLADLVRTDRHLHREVAGDSDLAEGVKILARAHQGLIWSRQRHLNQLRSALREFYPAALEAFGTDLASPDALAVLGAAPTPAQGRALSASRIAAVLKRAGRSRGLSGRAEEIRTALRSSQLEAPEVVSRAYGEVVRATVRIVGEMTEQIEALQRELEARFEEHPDAEILRSLPGLARSSAPGSSRSSATTEPATSILRGGRTTRAPPRSPRPRGARGSPWRASPATGAWPTPSTCGPSARSRPRREPAASTTSKGPRGKLIARRCEPSRTGGSASCTGACGTGSPTGKWSPGRTQSRSLLDKLAPWDV